MRKQSIALAALLLGGFAVCGTYFHLKSKVRAKLPQGVTAAEVNLGLNGVTLKGVQIDRPWIKGSIDEVWISRDEQTVTATGGTLVVDLDKKPAGHQGGDKRTITASKLSVHVTRGDASALLTGTSWDGQSACTTSGDITYPFKGRVLKAHVSGGCLDRESKHAWATIVVSRVTELPAIPGLKLTEASVVLEGGDVRWGDNQIDAKLEKFDVGPVSGTDVVYSDEPDTGKNLSFGTLTVNHPWLHTGPVTFPDGVKVGAGHWKPGAGLPTGWVSIGLPSKRSVGFKYDIGAQTLTAEAQDCFDWQNALPDPLQKPLWPAGDHSMSWTGKLSFSLAMKPAPKLTLDAQCKAVCSTVPNLKEPFAYTAYKPDGTTFVRKTGPGTPDWLSVAEMGHLPMAVINMEDFAFPWHKGYLTEAFQNSLTDNVAKGRFARGGSTITQQTAKNLWLTRDKTLGRKIDELFLAQALEGCYSKDEILSLYLNIIEFGPDVYGAKAGAKLWFGKAPDALTPTEAFWLASILPAPRKATAPSAGDLSRIDGIMSSLAKQGRIPDVGGDVGGPVDTAGWELNQ